MKLWRALRIGLIGLISRIAPAFGNTRYALRPSRWRHLFISTACVLACVCDNALASTGPIQGQIGTVWIIGSGGGAPGNLDFRLLLVGTPVICNGQTWAYINVTDANYAALVSSILTAKTLGSTVMFYVNQDSNGYCQLATFYVE